MSETRRPIETWSKYLPLFDGKKPAKSCRTRIELYPSWLWAVNWQPSSPLFYPRLPLNGEARKAFWMIHYRIRVNGRWYGSKAKYQLFTKKQIRETFFN